MADPRRSPGRRSSSPRRPKVPLTYYRSAGSSSGSSPFEKTPKSRRRSYIRVFSVILNIAVIVLVLLGLGYSLIVKSSPKLILNSQIYHPAGIYRAYAAHQLGSFSNHNKLSFNENSVIEALRTKFPEIANASLELPIFSQSPTIRLDISKPSLFLKNSGHKYIVDDQGMAVAQASEVPTIRGLPEVTDQNGFSTGSGKRVLTSQNVAFINFLVAQCHRASVPIASLELPRSADQLNLRTADHNYYVKFFLAGDAIKQVGQFLAARHQLDVDHKHLAQYLDVRIAGKIFYK